MLVFWKLLLSEDISHYEKDITDPKRNASEIKPYSLSTGDKAINYFLGILFIFLWATSTFLNPLLIQHFRRSSTKASSLFRLLASTDFLTNIWPPLIYTYTMITPELFASSSITLTYTRTWACLIGCFSQITSFLLAVSRAIKIVFPFFGLKRKYMLFYLVGYFLYMIVNNTTFFVLENFSEKNDRQKEILKIGLDLCFWANFAHCCAGVFVSIFTVLYLYFTTRFAHFVVLSFLTVSNLPNIST